MPEGNSNVSEGTRVLASKLYMSDYFKTDNIENGLNGI